METLELQLALEKFMKEANAEDFKKLLEGMRQDDVLDIQQKLEELVEIADKVFCNKYFAPAG